MFREALGGIPRWSGRLAALVGAGLFLLLCGAAAGQPESPPLTTAAVLEKVRRAVGYSALAGRRRGLLQEGAGTFAGLEGTFSFAAAADGRFVQTVRGPVRFSVGYDGRTAWEVDWNGMPRELERAEREATLLPAWVQSGAWLNDRLPLRVSLPGGETTAEHVVLALGLEDGAVTMRLRIDRTTWLPQTLLHSEKGRDTRWELRDHRPALGMTLPHRVTLHSAGPPAVSLTRSVRELSASPDRPFRVARRRPRDTVFDAGRPARVPSRAAGTGHLLVRPRVNGREAGWFILDTGAGALIVTPSAAEAAGMPALGRLAASGVGGTAEASFRKSRTFELGPLRATGLTCVAMDLGALTRVMGAPIDGICGYDLFSRAVVEVGAAPAAVALHDPERYRLPRGGWQQLSLAEKIPYVRARFEGGREGRFKLDTGSSIPVIFHSPAVERLALLKERQTTASRTGGVGGATESRTGTLEWFELAGRRFRKPEVRFSLARTGELADAHALGAVGAPLLAPFTTVLDYARKRIAFLENEEIGKRGRGKDGMRK